MLVFLRRKLAASYRRVHRI